MTAYLRTQRILVPGQDPIRFAIARLQRLVGNDPVPPVISSISPAAGTTISPSQAISLTVTDDVALRLVILLVSYSGLLAYEVIHDGTSFAPMFAANSTRIAVFGGWQYSILRTGGWPGNPTITPFAVDTSGNEN